MQWCKIVLLIFSLFISTIISAQTKSLSIPMFMVSNTGQGAAIGSIAVMETRHGLLFTPKLHGLPPGKHGFHIHENPSCAENGNAAGSHLDPNKTGRHLGPYGAGHMGDLPILIVNKDGTATQPVLTPRLKKLSEVENHSLMIHQGSDNYSDLPQPMGGGGARIACGVVP